MAKTLICGVDPGYGGGLAIIDPATFEPIGLFSMPLCELRGRNHIDTQALADILREYAANLRLCLVERVAASPRMGVSSAFRFGEGYGVIQGVAIGLKLDLLTVSPNAWKAAMNATADKNLSRELAARLFPAAAKHLAKKKNDGLAEALLIAAYGTNVKACFDSISGEPVSSLN